MYREPNAHPASLQWKLVAQWMGLRIGGYGALLSLERDQVDKGNGGKEEHPRPREPRIYRERQVMA